MAERSGTVEDLEINQPWECSYRNLQHGKVIGGKILKATINMEDDITVIAGANNSGKTSIVELFNYVFNAKGALCSDDFPVYESQEWCTAVFPYFQAQFKQENKKG